MNKENYSRNQCSVIIRVDGDELELPVNFGLSAREIRAIYPYLAKFANAKMENPALKFARDAKDGKYSDMEEDEYAELVDKVRRQSDYWYGKPEASLLELAMRLALDIKFKDIQEIQDAFSTVTPFERIKVDCPVSEEEANRILRSHGMENDAEQAIEPVEESDVEMGAAGNMKVDIYDSGEGTDFLSEELDSLEESKVEDRFSQIVSDSPSTNLPDRYKSNYQPSGFKEDQIGEDGLLNIYKDDGSADDIFGDEHDDGSTAAELLGGEDGSAMSGWKEDAAPDAGGAPDEDMDGGLPGNEEGGLDDMDPDSDDFVPEFDDPDDEPDGDDE